MQIGVVYPQTELASDPTTIRAYVSGVEQLGFRRILTYDHVLGADPAVHPGWAGPYDIDTTFHEPLVLFGFLAAITTLELVTGIIIAPQRQTALIAKQAAEVDILTEGRFRLGIGVGWNPVEMRLSARTSTREDVARRSRSVCSGDSGRTASLTTTAGSITSTEPASLPCPSSARYRSGWAVRQLPPSGGWAAWPMDGFP